MDLPQYRSVRPDVFRYQDVPSYLRAVLAFRKSMNPRFSQGVWTRAIGLKSKGLLCMVLKGTRAPSPGLIERLILYLELSPKEAVRLRELRKRGIFLGSHPQAESLRSPPLKPL